MFPLVSRQAGIFLVVLGRNGGRNFNFSSICSLMEKYLAKEAMGIRTLGPTQCVSSNLSLLLRIGIEVGVQCGGSNYVTHTGISARMLYRKRRENKQHLI